MVVEEEVRCPSCGRFVGAHYKCPYCGARIKHRLSLKLFKYGSIWMAIVGVVVLYLVTTKVISVPVVKVAEITEAMNFANVRVSGSVVEVKPPTKKGMFNFTIDDGTGELKITSFGNITKDLERLDRFPKFADEIEALGAIKVSDQYGNSLQLQSAQNLKIKKAIFPLTKIKDIYPLEAGSLVKCFGRVKGEPEVKYNNLDFWVEDETGKIKVRAHKRLYQNLKETKKVPREGDKVHLAARVYVKGRWRSLTLVRLDIFRIVRKEVLTPEEEIPKLNIGLVTSERMGKMVECEGKVLTLKRRTNPTNIVIADDTGKIEVVFWPDVEKGVSQLVTIPDARISVIGKVSMYRGMMQVKVFRSEDIRLAERR
jgi:DNA/RNA endonuclease YhcR with UshA esterase domain